MAERRTSRWGQGCRPLRDEMEELLSERVLNYAVRGAE